MMNIRFTILSAMAFFAFGRGSGTEGMEPSPVHRLCFRAQYHGEADAEHTRAAGFAAQYQ